LFFERNQTLKKVSGTLEEEMNFLQIQDILQSHVDEEGLLDQSYFKEIVLDSLHPSLFHKLEKVLNIQNSSTSRLVASLSSDKNKIILPGNEKVSPNEFELCLIRFEIDPSSVEDYLNSIMNTYAELSDGAQPSLVPIGIHKGDHDALLLLLFLNPSVHTLQELLSRSIQTFLFLHFLFRFILK
jgi:hypothetical protein